MLKFKFDIHLNKLTMKKNNLKCIALSILVLAFSAKSSFTQQQDDLIIGKPDVYQDYILLNPEADSSIVNWEVVVSRLYYDTVTNSVESKDLVKLGTRGRDSYIRLDPFYREKYDYLKVVVYGLDDNNQVVASDNWYKSEAPYTIRKEPRCWNTCVGKTYAFDVVINDRVNLQGVLQSGHTVSYRPHNTVEDGSAYIPKYRHLTFNEANTIDNNSTTQCAADLSETYCHYGITNFNSAYGDNFFTVGGIDGVKIIKREGITTDDQLKDKNGVVLTGTVYSIQKDIGKWQDENFTMSDELANEADIPCGDFLNSITSMINHANSHINLDNNLSCNGFGGGVDPWADLPFNVWSDLHDDWVNWDEDIYDVLDTMEYVFDDNFDGNTSGVDWWPSDDVSQIQFINIGKGVSEAATQSTIVLYRDSLFNSNGEPNYNDITLQQGLYNIHFTLAGGHTFPLILGKTNSETQGFAHTNFLDVNIYPNPITSGNLTIAMEADATLNFDYKILDGQGAEVFNKDNITIQKDNSTDLFVPVDNFPSGTLMHVFEMSDGSTVSYNSIKN